MANGIATNSVSDEYYVLQINGRVNSIHRRYEDALGKGLQLKKQFPSDNIKVCVRNSAEELQQRSVSSVHDRDRSLAPRPSS
jgi:hypothetical protein